MEDSARQVQEELRGSIKRAVEARRPILTHLNADTTWLIQLPYPISVIPPPSRSFYRILIDPWFSGPQSDVAGWFSTQWHATASSIQTMRELNERLEDVEQIAQTCRSLGNEKRRPRNSSVVSHTYIDAVLISHEFTDHLHKATMLEIDPTVPIFATEKAAGLIESWQHFDSIHAIPSFVREDPDWRKTATDPLPQWIGISRVTSPGNALYYHSAILVTFDIKRRSNVDDARDEGDSAETIVYSPHGIIADDLGHLPLANPPLRTLALLHGLHDVGITLTKQLNLGAHNGLRAQRVCAAKYWVGTHDEIKKAGGVLAPFLRRNTITIQQAIEKERKENGFISDTSGFADMRDVHFSELRSGESLLLL